MRIKLPLIPKMVNFIKFAIVLTLIYLIGTGEGRLGDRLRNITRLHDRVRDRIRDRIESRTL